MKNENLLLLARRRQRRSNKSVGNNNDGLMDILSNVVGMMALIGSLTGIFATTSSLNIQAPMQKKVSRNFHMLQVSKEGIWDLQPAISRMAELDRQRAEEVNRCANLLPPEQKVCDLELDGWQQADQLGPIKMNLSHAQGTILRNGPPTITVDKLKEPEGWLDEILEKLAEGNQAVFIVLEEDGFEIYRTIKSKAIEYNVPIGWEPWYKDDPIYFWGNTGRALTVQ